MIRNAKVGKEIVIMAKEKVGALSEVAKALADRGINIAAISAQTVGGMALIHLVVDEHLRACDLLRKKKIKIEENAVVILTVDDKPGALKHLTRKLASKKVNLSNLYGSTLDTFKPCVLVLSTSDNQKALIALKP